MPANNNILLGLCLGLLLVIFPAACSRQPEKPPLSSDSGFKAAALPRVDPAELDRDYRAQTAALTRRLEALINALSAATGAVADNDHGTEIAAIKDGLLALKLNEDMKEIHLALLACINQLEDYTESGETAALQEAQRLMAEIKSAADWL